MALKSIRGSVRNYFYTLVFKSLKCVKERTRYVCIVTNLLHFGFLWKIVRRIPNWEYGLVNKLVPKGGQSNIRTSCYPNSYLLQSQIIIIINTLYIRTTNMYIPKNIILTTKIHIIITTLFVTIYNILIALGSK